MRIAINTGGGDAPGLNAVIRAAVLAAQGKGWDIVGIRRGYSGLFKPHGVVPLTERSVSGITHRGGTILGTSNRGNPFSFPVERSDGTIEMVDRSDQVISRIDELGIDCLIAVGGDGSLRIAAELANKGLKVVGVPKTIDNDLDATTVTFGFHTAVQTATDAIGKLHSTAEAHQRVMVVELMGRHAGWIALFAGFASTADVILIPEIPYELRKVAGKIEERWAEGSEFAIIVVAEGALPKGGEASYLEKPSLSGGRRLWGALPSGSHGGSKNSPGTRPAAWCSGTFSAEGSQSRTTAFCLSDSARRRSSWSRGDTSAAWWRWTRPGYGPCRSPRPSTS